MKLTIITLNLLVYHGSTVRSRGLKKCSEPKVFLTLSMLCCWPMTLFFFAIFQGSIGEIIVRNCSKLSCKRRGQKGVWEESFNSVGCCPYQDTGIMIGDTLTTAVSGDGCIIGKLSCVGSNGRPIVDLKVENICSKVNKIIKSVELYNVSVCF
jgi:hypothetical protein